MRVLTNEGLEVDIALNGRIGQDMLEKRDYALLLIDLRTPVMNGKELFQHISEKHPELMDRVILTTGDVVGKDTQSFVDQTGRLFLPKPFSPEELRAIVRKALSCSWGDNRQNF